MGTSGNSALVTQLNLWPRAGHHVSLRRKNESDSSSAKSKVNFAQWEASRTFPMAACMLEWSVDLCPRAFHDLGTGAEVWEEPETRPVWRCSAAFSSSSSFFTPGYTPDISKQTIKMKDPTHPGLFFLMNGLMDMKPLQSSKKSKQISLHA